MASSGGVVSLKKPDSLLRPSVVARRLGVCTETVWRWMRKGAMPFEEVGPYHKKRIRESTVLSMLRSNTSSANDCV